MFSQLNTGEIHKDDILKYYKTSYDPMLELHNNFFDGCLDHLVNQELNNNKSFFMKLVDKVKDLFSQGANYEPLIIKDLGITIKCDNYVNQIISDNYIAKKKLELAKVKSNLVSINQGNQGNFRRPMGRVQSERGITVTAGAKTTTNDADLLQLIAENKNALKARTTTSSGSISGGSSGSISGSSSGITGGSISGGSSGSSSGSISGGSSISINGSTSSSSNTSTTQKSSTATLSGGSSTTTISGVSDFATGSKAYSGSTISGAGATYNIFSDRRIYQKDGKQWVDIGGVAHLIDNDGWIHGLNIDSEDKNINYNIAYENYFDYTCDSMLEFMKKKYTALLADYKMNRDYINNLQIDNRRSIIKIDEQNKAFTAMSLKYNSCEMKMQDEKLKKSTLYHNIKDIKNIKVSTKVKELTIQITNLTTQINTYKTEIINLKIMITNCNKNGDIAKTTCNDDWKKKCDLQIIDLTTTCTKEKKVIIIENTTLTKDILKIRLDYNNCLSRVKQCTADILTTQLTKCKQDLTSITTKYTQLSTTINGYTIDIQKLKTQNQISAGLAITWENKYKACDSQKKLLLTYQTQYNECSTQIITIKNDLLVKQLQWNISNKICEKNKIDCDNDSKDLLKCRSDFETFKTSITVKQTTEINTINDKCSSDKQALNLIIDNQKKTVIDWKTKYETCDQDSQNCQNSYKTCTTNLTTKIETITNTCTEDKASLQQVYEININKYTTQLKTCTDNAQKEKDAYTIECEKNNTTNLNLIQSMTVKYDTCNTQDIGNQDLLIKNTQTITQLEIDLKVCNSERDSSVAQLKVITDKTKIDCTTITTNLQIQITGCTNKNTGLQTIITGLDSQITSLKLTISQLNKTIEQNKIDSTNNCVTQRDLDTKKEQSDCNSQILIINNQLTQIKNQFITINAKYDACQNVKNTLDDNSKIAIQLQQCLLQKDDFSKKYATCLVDKSTSDTTIISIRKDITNITNNYNLCIKDRDTSDNMISYQNCLKEKQDKQKLIETLILQMQQSLAGFNLIIAKLQLSYDNKIQKLQEIISSTTSDKTTIKITIENKIIKKEIYITDRDNYDKTNKEYQLRIAQLLLQRKSLMDRLDTIDSNNISIIAEIKTEMITIQTNLDSFYTLISKLDVMIRQNISDIAAIEAELTIYKSNEEYYLNLINSYQLILVDMNAYITELKTIAQKDVIKNNDGSTFNLTVYINQIDTQNKDIVFTLKNQIEAFNVKILEMQRSYAVEYKNFRTEINKGVETCNIKINLLNQEKNDLDDTCEKKTKKRVDECEKSNTTIIFNLKAKYRQDMIDLKRKCNDTNNVTTTIDTTYNFEIFKKNCIILIERNTENDCKAIDEVRSTYNEKCIMTALPTSTKDLTTFASSDLNDGRNQAMMNRLDTKK